MIVDIMYQSQNDYHGSQWRSITIFEGLDFAFAASMTNKVDDYDSAHACLKLPDGDAECSYGNRGRYLP